jgi:hypothetical protein
MTWPELCDQFVLAESASFRDHGVDMAALEARPEWQRLEELLGQIYTKEGRIDLLTRCLELRARCAAAVTAGC